MLLATPSRRRILCAVVAASAALLTATSTADASWLAPHDVPVGINSQSGGAAIAPDGTVTSDRAERSGGSQRALSVTMKRPGSRSGRR